MRGVLKTLIAAGVVLLLAAGLAACGGSDDSSSTATEAAAQEQTGSKSDGGASSKDEGNGSKGTGGGEASSGKPGGGEKESAGEGSGNFVPKPHNDSGGGSEKFRTKGGDNSVQEFGAEADASEFDQAATVLHNFLDSRAAEDWAATCEYLAKSVTDSLEKLAAQAKRPDASCGEILEGLVNPAAKQSIREEADQADVRSLRVEGEQAFVIYTVNDGTVMTITMANEGGVWKVGSLAGTPLS